MKAIIDDKLYDTETAEFIYAYADCDYVTCATTIIYIYRTKKGTYFKYDMRREKISKIKEKTVKEIISRFDIDKYIELFGDVEEA